MNALTFDPIALPDAALLTSYRDEHPFVFASPTRTLLVREAEPLDAVVGRDALERQLDEQRRRPERAGLLFGALPFDTSRVPARLFSARDVEIRGPAGGDLEAFERTGGDRQAATARVTRGLDGHGYRRSVARALERLHPEALEKVVLSRRVTYEMSNPPSAAALVRTLAPRNPGGYTFGLRLFAGLSDHAWLVGASPELLVRRRGVLATAYPLAGSVPRTGDVGKDAERAAALLRSGKDLREHAIVVSAVADTLNQFCCELHVPTAPHVVATPTMLHLGTRISGQLRSLETTSAALAHALHPTPAVCGHPRDAALDTIRALEPFDRGLFTGAVGYCDVHGDGEWAVTIRCAEVRGTSVALYAGAGIVAGSDPETEFDETSAKLETMATVLGLSLPTGSVA